MPTEITHLQLHSLLKRSVMRIEGSEDTKGAVRDVIVETARECEKLVKQAPKGAEHERFELLFGKEHGMAGWQTGNL